MISNRQIISDALAMLGVLAETEVASAEQAQQGLRFLNSLMAEWQELGVMQSYYTQTVLADDCPIPEADEQVVSAALALRLSSMYKGADVSIAAAIANRGYQRLLRTALNDSMTEADLSHLPGAQRTVSILN